MKQKTFLNIFTVKIIWFIWVLTIISALLVVIISIASNKLALMFYLVVFNGHAAIFLVIILILSFAKCVAVFAYWEFFLSFFDLSEDDRIIGKKVLKYYKRVTVIQWIIGIIATIVVFAIYGGLYLTGIVVLEFYFILVLFMIWSGLADLIAFLIIFTTFY